MSETAEWRTRREQALLQLESGKRPEDRTEAANVLCDLAWEDTARAEELSALVPRLLSDRQVQVQRAGLELAAATLEVPELEPLLSRFTRDASVEVRLEAVRQLAGLELPSTRGVLATALQDDHFAVRFEAACGMAALKHSAGVEVLVVGLERAAYRFRALGMLGELQAQEALPAVRRVFERWFLSPFERTQAAAALASLGDARGVDHLFKRAAKRWTTDRPMAVELLGSLRLAGAYERLTAIAADENDACRDAAVRGLGALGDGRAKALLESLAAQADAALGQEAKQALAQLEAGAERASRVEETS